MPACFTRSRSTACAPASGTWSARWCMVATAEGLPGSAGWVTPSRFSGGALNWMKESIRPPPLSRKACDAPGIGRGDVVALLLPSTPFYLVAYLAAARLGAITTGINVRYRRTEIGHILGRSGSALLLAVERWHEADFRAAVEGLRPGLPELRDVVWYPAARLAASTARAVADLGGSGAPPAVAVAPDDPVAIVFTSGTTGVPKGACFTHRNLLAVAEIEARRYARGASPAGKHLAAGLSFAHIGTMARIAIQLSQRGATLIHDAFDPAAVLETIERERLHALA